MKLFDTIRKKLESRLISTGKNIENKRLEAEQAKQAEKDYVKKLLKSPIPSTECLIELTHLVREEGYSYIETAYFMCDTPRGNMYYGQQYDVTKITGDNIGAKETLLVRSTIIEWGETAVILVDGDNNTWSGRTDNVVYIPSHCKTIADLNVYANKQNAKWKVDRQSYQQAQKQDKVLDQQNINK